MVMRLESMSKTVVSIVDTLSSNEELRRLLSLDTSNPYGQDRSLITSEDDIKKNNGVKQRIFPFPFEEDAQTKDGSFIRVYYNDADFDASEVIAESVLHIDIVVSKNLWLISGNRKDTNGKTQRLVRPYELAGRIIDLVGRRSISNSHKVKFTGLQHMYVNAKFDCIRLYAEYMSVETENQRGS